MNAVHATAQLQVDLQIAADESDVPDGADWERWVGAALSAAGHVTSGVVSVRLINEEESAALNSAYRDKPGATNVLAFTGPGEIMHEATVEQALPELGDLAICLPVACREAEEQGKPPVAHLAHLVVHGTLHLIGYDHQQEADAERMESLEVRVLDGLVITNPSIASEQLNDSRHE
jgi:probable rRNA maturation factor